MLDHLPSLANMLDSRPAHENVPTLCGPVKMDELKVFQTIA